MDSVDAPIFDLREVLIFRNRFHADADLIVDNINNSSSSIEHLIENLLGNRDVLRILHIGYGQDRGSAPCRLPEDLLVLVASEADYASRVASDQRDRD